jgi:hypothetical protein
VGREQGAWLARSFSAFEAKDKTCNPKALSRAGTGAAAGASGGTAPRRIELGRLMTPCRLSNLL